MEAINTVPNMPYEYRAIFDGSNVLGAINYVFGMPGADLVGFQKLPQPNQGIGIQALLHSFGHTTILSKQETA
jgi:hypothetical protein